MRWIGRTDGFDAHTVGLSRLNVGTAPQVLQHDCNHILLVTVISADPAIYVESCKHIYVGIMQAWRTLAPSLFARANPAASALM